MALSHSAFQHWLDQYVAAWRSNDPQQIGDLFSEDCEYRYHPQSDPVIGREAIVADWLKEPAQPGSFEAKYEPLAIDGQDHVSRGWSRYFEADGKTLADEYFNIYLCQFDDAGRCRNFTEWWMQGRAFARAAREKIAADAVAAARAASGPA